MVVIVLLVVFVYVYFVYSDLVVGVVLVVVLVVVMIDFIELLELVFSLIVVVDGVGKMVLDGCVCIDVLNCKWMMVLFVVFGMGVYMVKWVVVVIDGYCM